MVVQVRFVPGYRVKDALLRRTLLLLLVGSGTSASEFSDLRLKKDRHTFCSRELPGFMAGGPIGLLRLF